jgi:hypothetical protein
MPSTPGDNSPDTDADSPHTDADSPDTDDTTHYASRETVADLVTAVKLVVGGLALFVTALFGGALGRGGGQVALFLFVGGVVLLALGYWSLPEV